MCQCNYRIGAPNLEDSKPIFIQSSMDLIVDFPQRPFPLRTKSPTKVSFAEHFEVMDVTNLTHEHKADLWFTSHELESFKDQLSILLRDIVSTNSTVGEYAQKIMTMRGDTSAFLGLENYMAKNTASNIRYRRRSICNAILMEQERQSNIDVYDPEAMSRIAGQFSEVSRERARITGLLHADKSETPMPLDDAHNCIRHHQSAWPRILKEFSLSCQKTIFNKPIVS